MRTALAIVPMPAIGVRIVMLVQLAGAVRTIKFVAFTGNPEQRQRHQEHGNSFHRAAS